MEEYGRDESPSRASAADSVLGTGLTTRQLEAFGRKVTSTATQLMGPSSSDRGYQDALTEIHRELRKPTVQRRIFSLAQTTPTDLVRSKLSTAEIQSRAIASVPDELLQNIPEDTSTYSLFQGFQASLPEPEVDRRSHRRRSSKSKKLIGGPEPAKALPSTSADLKEERDRLNRRLEMMGVRKNMCSAEIKEIDNKIANLQAMRKIVLDRLAELEIDEAELEHELVELERKIEDMQDEEEEAQAQQTPQSPATDEPSSEHTAPDESFMSESIYKKLPSPRGKKQRTLRRSLPIRHEHFEPGTAIQEFQAHNDIITALDFDIPFGTMVSAALDDTVRVWDLNAGRCIGFLEGHHASVRCLQVEDNIVATGSMDASIRLWDLNQARPVYPRSNRINKAENEEGESDSEDTIPPQYTSAMEDCEIFTLEAHVDEVTALHFRGDTLISGSADKTLRQWDLVKGRCVQTLDVLWAAAQASATISSGSSSAWRRTARQPDASADFVGALQCFDAALACGTADGIIRLWDLRSGQVHRSLVGHTGPITALQFDDVHLVTGSLDRSVRIWDLRTGSIHDAFAYDHPIVSMMFDTRRIACAAGENVVKIYDKAGGRHWDCGAGVSAEPECPPPAIVERVRVQDGYLVEGRRDGMIGVWTC